MKIPLVLEIDRARYENGKGMPLFQVFYRKAQFYPYPWNLPYKVLLRLASRRNFVELSHRVRIGPGLYLGHPFGITINPGVVIGSHVNLSKGVTIGQENRGPRQGVPTLGNRVWIGVNATVVGKITIGDDVLIAPNTLVNCDVPSHSIVFGNPCIIKPRQNATWGYL